MSDRINHQYSLLDGILKATNYVALLTIFIAAMGLFGLIALFTRQRVRRSGSESIRSQSCRDRGPCCAELYYAGGDLVSDRYAIAWS